jgi:hypothetical protein
MPRLFFTTALVLLTAVPSLAQSAAADAPSVLTLESAIAEAQQNNREIKISNQNVLYANDEILAARIITLLLVPVLYSIFVLDLKIVQWGAVEKGEPGDFPL